MALLPSVSRLLNRSQQINLTSGLELHASAKVRKIVDGLRWVSAVFPPKTLNYAFLLRF